MERYYVDLRRGRKTEAAARAEKAAVRAWALIWSLVMSVYTYYKKRHGLIWFDISAVFCGSMIACGVDMTVRLFAFDEVRVWVSVLFAVSAVVTSVGFAIGIKEYDCEA